MYIGSLFREESGVGHEVKLLPPAEIAEYLAPWCGDALPLPLSLNGTKLLDAELRLQIRFDRAVFVDHVAITLLGKCGEVALKVLGGHPQPSVRASATADPAAKERRTYCLELGDESVRELTVSLQADYQNIIIESLDVFGAVDLDTAVYPTPKQITYMEGLFSSPTGISAAADARFAAEHFAEKYEHLSQKALPIGDGNICFEITPKLGEEEFSVSVEDDGAEVLAGSRAALLWASEKLLGLAVPGGFRKAKLFDAPTYPFRGVHLALPDRKDIPFLKRLVKHLLMPMGYNMIILEIAGVMEYKKHPRINEIWLKLCRLYEEGKAPKPAHYGFLGRDILSQDEVRELCDYFRLYGMEVVPEVQTCAHTQYITTAYPELAEIDPAEETKQADLFVEDERPAYYHCMCPKHPDYYKVTFEVMDEVIEVVQPKKYVHIGHDEIYTIGKCPRCQKAGAAAIYAEEVTVLHDHLAERGLTTMMWSDMMEEAQYETYAAIDKIPKDIICLSFTWYFHLNDSLDIEKRLVENGFRFMHGNLYSSHFPRFNQRKRANGYLGGQISAWVPCNEAVLGYEGKIFDFLYTAEMLWNEDYREELRRTYTALLAKRLPRLREYLHHGKCAAVKEKELPLQLDQDASCVLNRPAALADAQTPSVAEVPNLRADRIRVTHATAFAERREAWKPMQVMAAYRVSYADGTSAELPVHYGVELGEYNRPYAKPLASALYRHEGYIATYPGLPTMDKTEDGRDAVMYTHVYDNPCPDKEIVSVTLHVDAVREGNKIYWFSLALENYC